MHLLPAAILLCAFSDHGLPQAARGRGLSARFGAMIAVEGRDLIVRIALGDAGCGDKEAAPCLLGRVRQVVFEMRSVGTERWSSAIARPAGRGAVWEATFTSTAVPDRRQLDQPETIELRARVTGARGGTLLEIGHDEPLTVSVLTAPEAREVERALSLRADRGADGGGRGLIGHAGLDARAGSFGGASQ